MRNVFTFAVVMIAVAVLSVACGGTNDAPKQGSKDKPLTIKGFTVGDDLEKVRANLISLVEKATGEKATEEFIEGLVPTEGVYYGIIGGEDFGYEGNTFTRGGESFTFAPDSLSFGNDYFCFAFDKTEDKNLNCYYFSNDMTNDIFNCQALEGSDFAKQFAREYGTPPFRVSDDWKYWYTVTKYERIEIYDDKTMFVFAIEQARFD